MLTLILRRLIGWGIVGLAVLAVVYLGYLNAAVLWGGGPMVWLMTVVFSVAIGAAIMAR